MRALCLHGFTGSGTSWNPVVERIPCLDAWCPDLLGHDPGDQLASATFADEVDRLATDARERAWSGAVLAGYSLGARVALGLLLRHPGLFAAALLVGVHPGLDDEDERAARRAADEILALLIEDDGIEAFVDHWEGLPLFAGQRRLAPEVLAGQRRERLRKAPAGLARSLRVLGLGAMPSWRPRLAGIGVPVVLMAGGEDVKFRALAEEMAAALPRATVEIVPGAGHNLLLEAPRAVAAALRRLVLPPR